MRIDVNSFCSLSRATDFQEWLKTTEPLLHAELIDHLKLGKSCGSNKNKMKIIYDKIKLNGLDDKLKKFLKNTHPNMLIIEQPVSPSPENKIVVTADEANVHKVFPIYKPGFLMLPQQGIFIGDSYESAMNQIMNFLKNKISTDYMILKSNLYWHGYVEYFDRKFVNEIGKVKKENRPIATYKAKYGIK